LSGRRPEKRARASYISREGVASATLLSGAAFAFRGRWQRHVDLARVHHFVASEFGQAQGLSGERAPDADLLDRTRRFMRAECAELVVDDGAHLTRLRVRAAPQDFSADGPPSCVVELDSPQEWPTAGGTRNVLLAPVAHERGSAMLVMRHRHHAGSSSRLNAGFSRRDQVLLENIAQHFSGALRTSRLIYQLRYDASHDPLTGLSNRTVLCARLDGELNRRSLQAHPAADKPSGLAVLLLDLDRFKEVNDTLGHHVGDALLQVVAQRLRDVLPASATIARLGGDEFAIVLDGLGDPDHETDRDARRYADAVISSLAIPASLDDTMITTEVSIGVALAERETSSSELLRRADIAMYTAKTGSEPVVVYSASLDYGRAERLALAADLQRALEGDEFVLLYQPKLSLKVGHITGVEALVRWQHPQHGLLEPDAFIPLAEATGLVEPLTRIVLTKALRQAREWEVAGLRLSVAVNLPARSVANPALPGAVIELLGLYGIAPGQLILEITETSVMDDPERSVPVLEKLAAAGVTLSLDDFGTGYASLSFLQRLPVRELKIDPSFITGLADPDAEPTSTLLVQSILSLASGMDLRVVAEGVEDQACLDALHELGVDVAQGYFVGRPMEPQLLRRHLAGHPEAPAVALPSQRGQVRLPSSPGSSSL
jgi:diguanylate cyclase (GGDEF)-like protein